MYIINKNKSIKPNKNKNIIINMNVEGWKYQLITLSQSSLFFVNIENWSHRPEHHMWVIHHHVITNLNAVILENNTMWFSP